MIMFEVYQRDQEGPPTYDWRAIASNGQIIATSGGQGYTRPGRAFKALDHFLQVVEGVCSPRSFWFVADDVVRRGAK